MDPSDHSMRMAMSTVFETSTEITLFVRGWTTTTATSYTFTLIFLFALAMFNRFLGVLKFQLDVKHTEPVERDVPKLQLLTARRRRHAIPKDRLSPLPRYMAVAETDSDHEASFPSAPFLGPDPERTRDGLFSNLTQKPQGLLAERRWWSAYRRWSWRRDGTSSLLEGLRALVGYALMLAVMTFNVGVFFAVVGGIIVGELFLGRYAQPSLGWQDGACHD
ncbi:protein P80 [Aspergillus udagawae]|nr:protein P80 [Aspergillus udagawae]